MGETASEAQFRSGGLTVGAPVPATSSRPCLRQTCHAKCSLRAPGSPALYNDNAVDEFGFLLAELKRAFRDRLSRARQSEVAKNDIAAFASHCAANNTTCITFNYDDFLDEALWTTGDWNPHWGYGFFCRSSLDEVSIYENAPGGSTLLLLKLHGSINWWPRLGYSQPFVLDAITHHHGWKGVDRHVYPQSLVARHLEAEPVIVPPVLSKSGLVAQPVLRLVWALAFESLATADKVTLRRLFVPADRHGGSDAVLRSLAGPAEGRHRRRRPR